MSDQKRLYSTLPPHLELSHRILAKVTAHPRRIPLWRATADEALRITRNPLADITEVARVISKDPALYGKILGLVNSSLFSRGKSVTDLGVALVRLGLTQTKNLLLQSVAYSEIFQSKRFGMEIRYSLLHGMALALLSRELAPCFTFVDGELLFAFCMLHDIGISIALKNGEELDPTAKKETILKAAMCSHGALAATVLRAQSVPLEICDLVSKHDTPSADLSAGEVRILKLFHLLNGILLVHPNYPTHLRPLVSHQELALRVYQKTPLPEAELLRLQEWIPSMLTLVTEWYA